MFINNFYQKLKWFILSMTLQEQKPKNRAQSKHAKVTVHFVGKKILAHWVLEIDERQKKQNEYYLSHTISITLIQQVAFYMQHTDTTTHMHIGN